MTCVYLFKTSTVFLLVALRVEPSPSFDPGLEIRDFDFAAIPAGGPTQKGKIIDNISEYIRIYKNIYINTVCTYIYVHLDHL
jgi:hypothetical protein